MFAILFLSMWVFVSNNIILQQRKGKGKMDELYQIEVTIKD